MPLPKEIVRDKFRGTLIGCFFGDAFGAGFEGMNPVMVNFNFNIISERFPRRYTDCHFQIKSAPFLIDFHFKSAPLYFGFFNNN